MTTPQRLLDSLLLLSILIFFLTSSSSVVALSSRRSPHSVCRRSSSWLLLPCVRNGIRGTVKRFSRMTSSDDEQQQQQQEPDISSSYSILGVCGGIGSGKSQACQLLVSKLGCIAHLDADQLAHSVYARTNDPNNSSSSNALDEISQAFGPQVLTESAGEINRAVLGSIVFGDPAKMKILERIVWPHVRQKVLDEIDRTIRKREQEMSSTSSSTTTMTGGVIVVEAAVLLDAGWYDFMDGVWVVRAEPSVALDRLVSHRGLSKEEAEKRMQAQQSRRGMTAEALQIEVEQGIVTRLIDNNSESLDELTETLRTALHDPTSWKRAPSAAATATTISAPTK